MHKDTDANIKSLERAFLFLVASEECFVPRLVIAVEYVEIND